MAMVTDDLVKRGLMQEGLCERLQKLPVAVEAQASAGSGRWEKAGAFATGTGAGAAEIEKMLNK